MEVEIKVALSSKSLYSSLISKESCVFSVDGAREQVYEASELGSREC